MKMAIYIHGEGERERETGAAGRLDIYQLCPIQLIRRLNKNDYKMRLFTLTWAFVTDLKSTYS